MSRQIKFRAWKLDNSGYCTMHDWEQVKSSFYYYLEDSKLMQYTGLKDAKGVEIYEGDILEHVQGGFFKVEISGYYSKSDTGYGVNYLDKGDSSIFAVTPNPFGVEAEFKVVGNIHENPELLDYNEED